MAVMPFGDKIAGTNVEKESGKECQNDREGRVGNCKSKCKRRTDQWGDSNRSQPLVRMNIFAAVLEDDTNGVDAIRKSMSHYSDRYDSTNGARGLES